jgi:uncharacterized protein
MTDSPLEMNEDVQFHDFGILPEILPIFPLSGALLLPRGQLPLNIFEPRYLNMTTDSFGQGRFIGMVQPIVPDDDPLSDTVDLYEIGCVGRIVAFNETEDGRFQITLNGVSRFHIVEELEPLNGYRRVRAGYEAFQGDLEDDQGMADRSRLVKAMQTYFDVKNIEADWDSIIETPDDTLVTSLAMLCPFAPREKQAMLECAGVTDRSELLVALMEMSILDAGENGTVSRH